MIYQIDAAYFSSDKSQLNIPKLIDQQAFTWRTAYNTGFNPVTGYFLQDTAYGTFLRNNSGKLEVTNDPVGSSGAAGSGKVLTFSCERVVGEDTVDSRPSQGSGSAPWQSIRTGTGCICTIR